MSLETQPARVAKAFAVVDVAIVSGPVYALDDTVGVEPSVVYRMVADVVVVETATLWAEKYDPLQGEKAGATTLRV